jgi:hypothetical protein
MKMLIHDKRFLDHTWNLGLTEHKVGLTDNKVGEVPF